VLAAGRSVRAFVGLPDGSSWLLEEAGGADALTARLLAAGADELLREAEAAAP
jgi:hydroxymethylbilane synthase